MVVIAESLRTFLVSGNSIVVATHDRALHPNATRAAGIRIVADDRVMVFLPQATSEAARANLEHNRQIAICTASPSNYKAVQLKGRALAIDEPGLDDVELMEAQMRALAEASAPFGNTREQVRNLWSFDCWRVEVLVASVFTQTPGPGAGARWERPREG